MPKDDSKLRERRYNFALILKIGTILNGRINTTLVSFHKVELRLFGSLESGITQIIFTTPRII